MIINLVLKRKPLAIMLSLLSKKPLFYIEKGSSCKVASLDAEKAFDRVWRDGLFLKLLPK
jgi:hypothetical protein